MLTLMVDASSLALDTCMSAAAFLSAYCSKSRNIAAFRMDLRDQRGGGLVGLGGLVGSAA
jgi:hypothetical protein